MRQGGNTREPGTRGATFLWAWIGLLALWGAGFCLSCLLHSRWADLRVGDQPESVLAALLGESRVLLGDQFMESADTYFHQGVGHKAKTAFENSPFQRVASQISPDIHLHIDGTDVHEIMPWLWLAIRTNPSDIEPYLIAAYWLSGEANEPELAQEVLQEAFRRNPRNYRVLFEQGALHIRLGQRQKAERALTAALRVWPGKEDRDDENARKAKQEMLFYRSLLYELNGELERAGRDIEEVMHLFPGQADLARRLQQIRGGGRPAQEVMNSWNALRMPPQEDKTSSDHEHCMRPH